MARMNFDAMFVNKPEDIVVELFGKEYVVPGDPDIIKALKAERLLKQVYDKYGEDFGDKVEPEELVDLYKETAKLYFGEEAVEEWYAHEEFSDTMLFTIMTWVIGEIRKNQEKLAEPPGKKSTKPKKKQ
jgi:hypothetical protein